MKISSACLIARVFHLSFPESEQTRMRGLNAMETPFPLLEVVRQQDAVKQREGPSHSSYYTKFSIELYQEKG